MKSKCCRRSEGVRGSCGRPCGVGHWARRGAGRARCCWTCVPCAAHSVPRPAPATGCRACPPGARPDAGRALCVPAPLEWGGGDTAHAARVAALVIAASGLVVAIVCAAVFWRYRYTPVVKSASRELYVSALELRRSESKCSA